MPRAGLAPPDPAPQGRVQPETPIKRSTPEWGELYGRRTSVEREFGRLKHEYGLAFLRVRGLERVRLHADLTMLARLGQALARARAIPLAAQPATISRTTHLSASLTTAIEPDMQRENG